MTVLADYPELMNSEEVGVVFRRHRLVVNKMCREGELPGAFKLGQHWRIPRSTVAAMIRASEANGRPKDSDVPACPEVGAPEVARPNGSDVRAWAEANGMPVGTRGRLSFSLIDSYKAAALT
jgi:hypothetical protein